jgi:hypothetical protein
MKIPCHVFGIALFSERPDDGPAHNSHPDKLSHHPIPARVALAPTDRDHPDRAVGVGALAGKTDDGAVVRRLLAIPLVLEGRCREVAASQNGMTRQTPRDWVRRYSAEEVEGLRSRTPTGTSAANASRSPITSHCWPDSPELNPMENVWPTRAATSSATGYGIPTTPSPGPAPRPGASLWAIPRGSGQSLRAAGRVPMFRRAGAGYRPTASQRSGVRRAF